jgi:NADPH:quinone reductase-like Zn-dependent oxidoreductase
LAIFGPKVLGFDASGTIEALGSGCSRLKVGDEVWADLGQAGFKYGGIQMGAWAQYAVADESQVGLKPQGLNFTEAAALPLAALTDYQALKKAGSPWTGKKNLTVVVTSGSGGTGTPAIQLAKTYGAVRIITASSPSHTALLKELGATDVFDYHKGTIWEQLSDNSVDVVYDNYGAAGTADAAMSSIRPGGVFVFLPGKGGAVSKHPKEGVKQINYGLCDSSKHEDLDALKAIADKGQLKAVVQEIIPLDEINRALNTSFGGHVVGKLAIDCTVGYKTVHV